MAAETRDNTLAELLEMRWRELGRFETMEPPGLSRRTAVHTTKAAMHRARSDSSE